MTTTQLCRETHPIHMHPFTEPECSHAVSPCSRRSVFCWSSDTHSLCTVGLQLLLPTKEMFWQELGSFVCEEADSSLGEEGGGILQSIALGDLLCHLSTRGSSVASHCSVRQARSTRQFKNLPFLAHLMSAGSCCVLHLQAKWAAPNEYHQLKLFSHLLV